MAWLYVPGLEVSNSESRELFADGIELFATSSGKHSPRRASWLGWKTRPWIRLLSGTISQPSMAERGVESWISSLRGSRASQSRLPETKEPKTTHGGSGLKSFASWVKWDPRSSSWRTCQGSLFEGSETFSETWPNSGSMLNGACSQRPPAEPRTCGGESSSLLTTPRTSGLDGGSNSRKKRVRLWGSLLPTPGAMDANREGKAVDPQAWKERQKKKASQGVNLHLPLEVAVKMLPTPSASAYGNNRGGGQGRVGPVRESLDTLAKKGRLSKMLPTPLSSDCKRGESGDRARDGGPSLPSAVGGRLNPRFVESMMMFPIGWTAFEPLETASFQRWLSGPGLPSSGESS